jgi:NADP-reducing hydrogenase subunit HndC
MADYAAQVLVCTNSEGAEDQRHCGDKSGLRVRQRFNELLVSQGLMDRFTVSNVGCTSQHRLCDTSQGSIIVYGPDPALGGTWYVASPDDVEEIVTEHLVNGRVVERLHNKERAVKFG